MVLFAYFLQYGDISLFYSLGMIALNLIINGKKV